MLDLCISFQVRIPINLGVFLNHKFTDMPKVKTKSPATYFLPKRSDAAKLPPETLTQSVATFIKCYDLIHSQIPLTPTAKGLARALASYGFTNVVPSLQTTPVLLSGLRVRRFLEGLIVPRVRILKYNSRIPPHPSLPLPPGFPPDF